MKPGDLVKTSYGEILRILQVEETVSGPYFRFTVHRPGDKRHGASVGITSVKFATENWTVVATAEELCALALMGQEYTEAKTGWRI